MLGAEYLRLTGGLLLLSDPLSLDLRYLLEGGLHFIAGNQFRDDLLDRDDTPCIPFSTAVKDQCLAGENTDERCDGTGNDGFHGERAVSLSIHPGECIASAGDVEQPPELGIEPDSSLARPGNGKVDVRAVSANGVVARVEDFGIRQRRPQLLAHLLLD